MPSNGRCEFTAGQTKILCGDVATWLAEIAMGLWKAQWDELITASGRKPFLAGAIHVRHDGAETVLSVHTGKALVTALIQLVIIAAFIVSGVLLRLYANPMATDVGTVNVIGYVLMGIGLLSLLAWLRKMRTLLFSARQVRLSTKPPQVTVVRGWQAFVFPASGLTARLWHVMNSPKPPAGPAPNAAVVRVGFSWPYRLELACLDDAGNAERSLCIATAGGRGKLHPVYALFRPLVGVAADDTLRRATLPDGGEAFVEDAALKTSGANFRSCKLVVHSESLATIRHTLGFRLFFALFLIVGLAVAIGVGRTSGDSFESGWHQLIVVGFGCVFALPGLLGVLGVFGGNRPKIIDLSRGVMEIPQGKVPVPELTTGMPLNRLAALQLCTYVVRSKNSSTTMYELNAILRGEDGLRIGLLDDSNRPRLEKQIQTLTTMLRLPLIDSTGGASPNDELRMSKQ